MSSGLELSLLKAVGPAAAEEAMQVVTSRSFGQRLVKRVRTRAGVPMGPLERVLVARRLRSGAVLPLRLEPDGWRWGGRAVLVGPALRSGGAARALETARALEGATPGALAMPDALGALRYQVRAANASS